MEDRELEDADLNYSWSLKQAYDDEYTPITDITTFMPIFTMDNHMHLTIEQSLQIRATLKYVCCRETPYCISNFVLHEIVELRQRMVMMTRFEKTSWLMLILRQVNIRYINVFSYWGRFVDIFIALHINITFTQIGKQIYEYGHQRFVTLYFMGELLTK